MHRASINAASRDDRADHVARKRKGEWAHEQPDQQRRASHQFQPSDQIGRRIGERNAVALEGAPLGVVADELAEREPEEGAAGRRPPAARSAQPAPVVRACQTAG
jgi:hypothetical protein